MGRVQDVIKTIEPHDSVERFTESGRRLPLRQCQADFALGGGCGWAANQRRENYFATGARPTMPPIPGLDQVDPLTSETLWQLQDLPERLLIVGGGRIGCELAQAFQRLGSQVTLVEMQSQLLPRDDQQVAAFMQDCSDV